MQVCANCGVKNPDQARFCMACGTPLGSAAIGGEVRKSVTVVFADVAGSTSLAEQLDPESLRRVMNRYFDDARRAVERHGGTVEKFIGDAVMAVFGIPRLHEDDALRAVRAAIAIREVASIDDASLRTRGLTLQVRIGVNTGEVVAGDGGSPTLVTGDAVNVASRLQHAAGPGEILIGDATYRLVRDAVTAERIPGVDIRGKTAPITAYRLFDVITGAPGFARRLDSRLVGRQDELSMLGQAFARIKRERACYLFTILGAAGIGKSRLVAEFLPSIAHTAQILRGRCLPYGDGITFWPVAEAIKQAANIADDDPADGVEAKLTLLLGDSPNASFIRAGILHVLGSRGDGVAVEETFWAVRKLLESLAERTPVVVVFDDIQWGEPTFLDLVEHIATWSRDAPMLLLCLARPELLDARPGWAGGKLNATSVLLGPLSQSDCDDLISNLLGQAGLAAQTQARIGEAAEGNPLFVEQMLSMLIDDGLVEMTNGHWTMTQDLSSVAVPGTIQALLGARLERLPPEERTVIERAAVVGKQFYSGAVKDLTADSMRARVDDHLMSLVRKDLIAFEPTMFAGEETLRFRHLLIRDVAYDAIPKLTRAELHAGFAAWLERVLGSRLSDYEEIAAYHLEQAVQYRREVASVDADSLALGKRASQLLESAGGRATGRGDMPAVAKFYARARALLSVEDSDWLDLSLALGKALYDLGEFRQAESILHQVLKRAHLSVDARREAYARIQLLKVKQAIEPEGFADDALAFAERALPQFEAEKDEVGLSRVWDLLSLAHNVRAGRAKQEEAQARAIEHARRAGDRRQELEGLAILVSVLFWGPTPVADGLRRSEQILTEVRSSRFLEARTLRYIGGFHAMEGRFEESRRMIAQARGILEDLGTQLSIDTLGFFVGPLELRAGRPEAAEAELRRNCDALRQRGEKSWLCSLAGMMAEALYRQGRNEEALSYIQLSRDSAASDDLQAQAYWRAVEGKIMARRGSFVDAQRLIDEALAIVRQTDEIEHNGDILYMAAEVAILASRPRDAEQLLRKALEMYERKGVRPSVKRVQETLAQLGRD